MKRTIEVVASDADQSCNGMCLLESAFNRHGIKTKVAFTCFLVNGIGWIELPQNAIHARQWYDHRNSFAAGMNPKPKFPFTFEVDIPE